MKMWAIVVRYRIRRYHHPRDSESRCLQVNVRPWDFGRQLSMRRRIRWPSRQNRTEAGILRRCRACCNRRCLQDRQSQHSRSPSGTPCRLAGEEGSWRDQRRSRHRQLYTVSVRSVREGCRTYANCQQPGLRRNDARSTSLTTTATWCRIRTRGTVWGTSGP